MYCTPRSSCHTTTVISYARAATSSCGTRSDCIMGVSALSQHPSPPSNSLAYDHLTITTHFPFFLPACAFDAYHEALPF